MAYINYNLYLFYRNVSWTDRFKYRLSKQISSTIKIYRQLYIFTYHISNTYLNILVPNFKIILSIFAIFCLYIAIKFGNELEFILIICLVACSITILFQLMYFLKITAAIYELSSEFKYNWKLAALKLGCTSLTYRYAITKLNSCQPMHCPCLGLYYIKKSTKIVYTKLVLDFTLNFLLTSR